MNQALASAVIAFLCFLAWVALLTALKLRNAPGLPPALCPDDVAQAHALLHRIGEHGRPLPGPGGDALVTALLVADAAISLWVAAPSLLPELPPLTAAVLVALFALVLAKVLRVGVNGLAVAIRRAQVRLRHGRLACSSSEADRDDARVMRACYRSAITVYPVPPRATWRLQCWTGIWPWLLYLGMIIASLLCLRLVGATTLEDYIGCVILTVLLLATLTYAVREGVAAESLTKPIADMRRICHRFESSRALREYLASEHRAVAMRLQWANGICANMLEGTVHGEAMLKPDFVTAWRARMQDPGLVQVLPSSADRPALRWEDGQ